jgi:hypothetical protein
MRDEVGFHQARAEATSRLWRVACASVGNDSGEE